MPPPRCAPQPQYRLAGRLSRSYWADGSPPASTKTSLGQKLRARARERWPQLTGIDVPFRGKFAYVTEQLPDGQDLPLCRLRYAGYASLWGFAIYRAGHDDYQDSVLPSGQFAGTPKKPSAAPAASISRTPPPGSPGPSQIHLRISGRHHWPRRLALEPPPGENLSRAGGLPRGAGGREFP